MLCVIILTVLCHVTGTVTVLCTGVGEDESLWHLDTLWLSCPVGCHGDLSAVVVKPVLNLPVYMKSVPLYPRQTISYAFSDN